MDFNSEAMTSMPSNGYGSPISPQDVFLENREVPSPSQYSDPSASPPSMHSPLHTYSSSSSNDVEKLEKLLKEEPRSPYSTTTPSGLTPALSPAIPHHQQHQQPMPSMQPMQNQHQQYQLQQQQYLQRSNQTDPNLLLQHQQQVHFGALGQSSQHLQGNQEQQQMQYPQDYELEQIINHSELPNTADGLTTTQDNNLLFHPNNNGDTAQFQHLQQSQAAAHHFGIPAQQLFNNNNNNAQQLQQTSVHHQQNQLPLIDIQQPVAEIFTNISISQTQGSRLNSEALQGNQASTVTNSTMQPLNGVEPNLTFESLIEGCDIKTETGVEEMSKINLFTFMDIIVRNIVKEAGVSFSPCHWSSNDVRRFLKICGDVCFISIPEMDSIDGLQLMKMTSTEFTNMIGCKDSDIIQDFLKLLIKKDNNFKETSQPAEAPEQILQVKIESVQQEPKQVKQEVVSHPLLPVPVVNHNQSQNAAIHQQLSQFKSGQNHLSIEMQASVNQQQQQDTRDLLEQQKQQHFRNYQQQQLHQPQSAKADHLVQQSQLPRYKMPTNIQQFSQTSFSQRTTPLHQQNLINNHLATNIANQNSRSMLQVNTGTSLLPTSSSIKSDSPVDSQMPMLQSVLPSPKSNPVPLQEGANCYIDDSGTDLSALLQQTSQQHPVTLDQQEESMETEDERTETPPPTTSSNGPSGRTHIQLWQFLKELLDNPKKYGSCIRWVDRQEAIFKIEDSVKVASLWGERKNRPQMNYDKLSRSIRQYYNKNIMKKTERSQRLVYQFCKPYGL